MGGQRIPTTIKIHPDILKEAKHFAIENDLTLSDLIELSLKRLIRK